LPKSHSDYGGAVKALTQIFSCLKQPQPHCKFKSEEDFKNALLGWKDSFSQLHIPNSPLETVLNLANAMNGKQVKPTKGSYFKKLN